MFEKLFSRRTANRNKRKRGFTVVEAVIAMAVIAIISATATSIIRRTLSSAGTDFECERARIYAENALEAFKYCDNILDFSRYVARDDIEPDGSLYDENDIPVTELTFKRENEFSSLIIEVAYPYSNKDRAHIDITVSNDSKVLFSIDYFKGE